MCELRKMLVDMADFFNYTLRCMCYYQGVQLSLLHQQRDNCTNKEISAPTKNKCTPYFISTRFISASTMFVSSTNCSTESCSGRFVMMSCA